MVLAGTCGCPIVQEGPSIGNSPICGQYLFMMLIESYFWRQCDIVSPCERFEPVTPKCKYDYIVVGAGTAGSIVAGRLSEDIENTVLLLEAGGNEPVAARVPSFYRNFWNNPETDWMYRTQPSSDYCLDQDGKGCYWPRGKVLGGSSVLNGMMYSRGHKPDFDHWTEACNCTSWSWEAMQKYFAMSEGNKQIGSLVNGDYHSATGRMPVQRFNYQHDVIQDILKTAKRAGYPLIDDIVDPTTPDGFTVAQAFNDNGQRVTTARAYLSTKMENLDVALHAHVTKVLFKGKRAIGVEYINAEGQKKKVFARKEVILSAGALNSPHILLLSGVGPTDVLEQFDIPQVADLPVGRNMRNHIGVAISYLVKNVPNNHLLDWNAFTEYMMTREGPLSSPGLGLTGFLYTSLGDKARGQPDIQIFVNGLFAECSQTGVIDEPASENPDKGYNVTVNAVSLMPKSVGYMTLQSADPQVAPLFYGNYLDHPDDMVMLKDAIKHVERLFNVENSENKYKLVLDRTASQPCDDIAEEWSDEWAECMIRLHTDPQNHQLGTTALGSVVDEELKVYGLKSLRVCDAGSMPNHITGNPQGAIMALAEKCADLIKQTYQ